jgi:hypothetical protein
MDENEFPHKGLSPKKAQQWIKDHPDADHVGFWFDQSDKLRESAQRFLVLAASAVAVGASAQIVSVIIRIGGGQ